MGGKCAAFYGWEPMRDVMRPGSCTFGGYIWSYADDAVDAIVTDKALECIEKYHPEFVYVYMPETDDKGGHDTGWMSETYLDYVSRAIDGVKKIVEVYGKDYTVIVTSDHGGHDRIHGTDLPEDMTIPMLFMGKDFEKGNQFDGGSILDIAPTIATLMGVFIPREWEGKSLI
jgi:bisphosphoglycerate-independent phosphoglycerate mutase (AlkP superfamily)